MSLNDNIDATGLPPVSILARTVAAGSEGETARLVLALRPVRPEEDGHGVIPLPRWPLGIHECLAEGEVPVLLEVRPIPINSGALADQRLSPASVRDEAVDPLPLTLVVADRENAEAATRIWAHVMPETEAGSFASLRNGLPPLQPSGHSVNDDAGNFVCVPGTEGDVALLTKMIRATELLRRVQDDHPEIVPRKLREAALASVKSFLEDDANAPLRALYTDLDRGELGSIEALEDGPDTNLDVTKRKRKALIAHALDAIAVDCSTARAEGRGLCSEDVATCIKRLAQHQPKTGCGCLPLVGDLDLLYAELLKVRGRFLLGAAMGEAELAQLQKSHDDAAKTAEDEPPPRYEAPDSETPEDVALAQNRLFGLDETPDLARLFRIFVDARVDAATLIRSVWRGAAPVAKEERFAFVRLSPEGEMLSRSPANDCDEHSRWSLVKLTVDAGATGPQLVAFAPATRAEALASLANKEDRAKILGGLVQRDGMMVLGARDGTGAPAHELVSTDLRAAAQGFEGRADAMFSLAALKVKHGEAADGLEAADGVDEIDPIPLQSGGVSLVAFGCASSISHHLGVGEAMANQPCEHSFLDAEDLATGRLPYLGIIAADKTGQPLPLWRPLSAKRLAWGRAPAFSDSSDIEDLVAAAAGPDAADAERRAIAQMTVDRTAGRDQTLADKPTVVISDVQLTYSGAPIGIETGLKDSITEVVPDRDFNIDRTITLPQRANDGSGDDLSALPLRFGMPVRMAFAASYLGGVSLPPDQVAATIEGDPTLAVPSLDKAALSGTDATQHGRRFLRSEPVAAPQVLLPLAEAAAEVAAYNARRPPKWLPDTTAHVTLRSEHERDRVTSPNAVLRIILPPGLRTEMAEYHGLFDDVSPWVFPAPRRSALKCRMPVWPDEPLRLADKEIPMDGLRDLHLDAAWGGAPILRRSEETLNDRRYISGAVLDDGDAWLTAIAAWEKGGRAQNRPTSPSGDGIFRRRPSSSSVRRLPYYPDPMAQRLVLRLRYDTNHVARDTGVVTTVEAVPVDSYPDPVPLAANIRDGAELTVEETGQIVKIEGQSCREIVVTVPPGVEAALDIWALPSVNQLAFWSEAIDTAATLCRDDCTPQVGGCGLLGRRAPSWGELTAQAKEVYDVLGRRPLPEIAGVQTIALRHAVDRPTEMPAFVQTGDMETLFLLRRAIPTDQTDADDALALGSHVLAAPDEVPAAWTLVQGDPTNALEGQIEADLGGFVAIDLPSTGTLEVFARGVAPHGGEFDDPNRGRSFAEKQTGEFPDNLDPDQTGIRPAAQLYGFQLAQDGSVAFLPDEALWARVSNLPAIIDDQSKGHVSLHAIFTALQDDDPTAIRTDISPLFADTKARQVEIKLRAVSRHRSAFIRRPYRDGGTVRGGAVELHGNAPAPEITEDPTRFQSSEWLGPVWLPASERPAQPKSAAEARPIIENRDVSPAGDGSSRQRVSRVRLWLERPWYSSGQDEKLGIILWPRVRRSLPSPYNFFQRGGRVLRPSLGDRDERDAPINHRTTMGLDRFEERYLPGIGKFLTRWGSDPVEDFPSAGWRDWKVPLEVFADFELTGAQTMVSARTDAGYAANLRLPIAEFLDEPDPAKKQDSRQRFLTVDLLTYEPRFDPATERWYVDITLDPGPMLTPFLRLGVCRYQEHAPRDLQLSYPAEPFQLQIPTARSAYVVRQNGADGEATVEVMVEGPASGETGIDGRLQDAFVLTRMNVHLVGRRLSDHVVVVTAQHRVAPIAEGRGTTGWRCAFTVPSELATNPELAFEVHVEEQAYRAAASPDLDNPDRMGDPSPRFLCTLKVPNAT